MSEIIKIHEGHALTRLAELPDNYFQCCLTSPPYYQKRDYANGIADWPSLTYRPFPELAEEEIPAWTGSHGLETTVAAYTAHQVLIGRAIRRTLRDDGVYWLNIGDKRIDKQTLGIPWRVAFALQADGWFWRSSVVWAKGVSFCPTYAGSVMPQPVTDRPTDSYEMVFLFSKSEKYYYNADAIREPATYAEHHRKYHAKKSRPKMTSMREQGALNGSSYQLGLTESATGGCHPNGRNVRSVWCINPEQRHHIQHIAAMPESLAEPCIKAGSRLGDFVLDPFAGSGTTLTTAVRLGRGAVGIEIDPTCIPHIQNRVAAIPPEPK